MAEATATGKSMGLAGHLHCIGRHGFADGWCRVPVACSSCTGEDECKKRSDAAGVKYADSVIAGQTARMEGIQSSIADPRSASGRTVMGVR